MNPGKQSRALAGIALLLLACLSIVVVRELTINEATSVYSETVKTTATRLLWDHTTDSKTSSACSGISSFSKASSAADPIVDNIKSSRGSSKIMKIVNNSEYADYGVGLIAYGAPWAVLFVFSLFGFPIYCCCNCKCCCSCCKNVPKSSSGCGKYVFLIIFLLSAAGVVAISIAGLVYATRVNSGYNALKCSFLLFVNEALSGVSPVYTAGYTWQGLNGVVDNAIASVDQISGMTSEFTSMANSPQGSNSFTASDYSLKTIASKYDSGTGTYLITNPSTGSSDFIIDMRYSWATYTSSSSVSYLIYLQRDMYQNTVYTSMANLKTAANKIQQSSTLSDAKTQLQDTKSKFSQVNDMKTQTYDKIDTADSGINFIQIGFEVYYAICLGCSIAMIVGTIFVVILNKAGCKCLSHLGWCVSSVFMIFGFLLSTFMLPVTVAVADVCSILDLDFIKSNSGIIPANVYDQIGICITGNGDLYTKYDLANKISFASDAMKGFEMVGQVYNSATDKLIYNFTAALSANLTDQKDNNPNLAARSIFDKNDLLKSLTESNCKSDIWAWNSAGCGSATQLQSSGDSNGACVIVPKISKSSFDSLIAARYSACSTAVDKGRYLVYYANELGSLLSDVVADITSFEAAMESDNNDAKTKPLLQAASSLNSKVGTVIAQISSNLRSGLNCTYMAFSYTRIYTALCQNFAGTVASLAILIIIISCLDVIAVIAITVVNRRYGNAGQVSGNENQKNPLTPKA